MPNPPTGNPLSEGEREILTALATPIQWRPDKPSKKRPFIDRRDIYVGQNSLDWWITYGTELPRGGPFWRKDVYALRDKGLIASTYPDTDASQLAFSITDAGRAALSPDSPR